MNQKFPKQENAYAPPAAFETHRRGEPWTLGGVLANSVRASVGSPLLAWVGLGVVPNTVALVDLLQPEEPTMSLAVFVLMLILTSVLAGGQCRIAIDLVRSGTGSLRAYLEYVRLAPAFFVLGLPLLCPVALAYLIPEAEPVGAAKSFFVVLFLIATVMAVFAMYRLSLSWYHLVDGVHGLRRSVAHSWRRTRTELKRFLALFVVTSAPLGVTWLLMADGPPLASTLLDIVVAPVVILSWAQAYDSGLHHSN